MFLAMRASCSLAVEALENLVKFLPLTLVSLGWGGGGGGLPYLPSFDFSRRRERTEEQADITLKPTRIPKEQERTSNPLL